MKELWKRVSGEIFAYLKKTDKMLLLMAIALSAFSCVLLYSLLLAQDISAKTFYMQIAASSAGIVAAIVISLLDYRILVKMWKLYVPIILVLMMLTLFTPLGRMRGGDGMGSDDRNWLYLGPLSIQPSEFLKICFILSFSYHVFRVKDHINKPKTLLLLIAHALVPIGLIFISGDYGTMIIFVLIFVAILFTAGLDWRLVLAGFGAAVLSAVVFWNFILDDYLKRRFLLSDAFMEENKTGIALQQYQGRLTLGSGQITGKGLFADNLLTTTPELHNDFIFAHVGQTLGFVGCLCLIVWIAVICIKLIINARSSSDLLGCCINVGVFTVLFFQSVINIGMVLCVLPVIGITLPFVSAGGTSVLATYCLLGLALSVYNHTASEHVF